MAKILRKIAKIFGSTAGVGQIAKFGSLAASSPAFTTDPAVIQSLSEYLSGWFSAVIGGNSPAIEDMNALCYLFAYQIAYIMQTGVPEWNTDTIYFIGSVVNDGTGKLYISNTDNNTGNPVSDTVNWTLFSSGDLSLGALLQQKTELEHYGLQTEPLNNSIGTGFALTPANYYINGVLLQDYVAAAGTISIIWAPKYLDPTDPNTSDNTNWTASDAAINLGTSVTRKVGPTSISFDKDNSSTKARITHDAGTPILNINGWTTFYFWAYLPTVTGVVGFNLIYDINGVDFHTYPVTTNSVGGPLVVGANLCKVNLNVGGTDSGAGWVPGQSFRYFHFEAVTTLAATTLTAVKFNGAFYEIDNPAHYVQLGMKLSIYNNSVRESMIVNFSNSAVSGISVTLGAALANSFVGGFGATSAEVYRSTLGIGDNQAVMQEIDQMGVALSGAILLTQEVRTSRQLRSVLTTGKLTAFFDVNTPQVYEINSVTGSTIVVADEANQSANLLNTQVVHVFKTLFADGVRDFIYVGDMTLSMNSSNTAGETTLTGTPPVGSVAGGFVVKKQLVAKYSAVAQTGANENFVTMTPIATDGGVNGVLLFDSGLPIPYPANVFGYWSLSGNLGNLNSFGPAPDLELVGSLNTNLPFKKGQFSTSNFTPSTNYYTITHPNASALNLQQKLAISVWIYPTATSTSYMIDREGTAFTLGFFLLYHNGANNVSLVVGGTAVNTPNGSLPLNQLHHVVAQYDSAVVGGVKIWIDNVLQATGTATINAVNANLGVGVTSNGTTGGIAAADRLAQLVIWTGINLTPSDVAQIYNDGLAQLLGFGPLLQYQFKPGGVAGQKLSIEGTLSRDTTAVIPFIGKMGIVESS